MEKRTRSQEIDRVIDRWFDISNDLDNTSFNKSLSKDQITLNIMKLKIKILKEINKMMELQESNFFKELNICENCNHHKFIQFCDDCDDEILKELNL